MIARWHNGDVSRVALAPAGLAAPAASSSAPVALILTAEEFDIAWRTVYGEARGETDAGKQCVAWAIRNRVEIDLHNDGKPDWWGEGVKGVCLAKWQFTCWADHNRSKLLTVSPADRVARACQAAVRAVFGGVLSDPTGRATHYYAPKLVTTPSWARGKTPSHAEGGHLFFANIG